MKKIFLFLAVSASILFSCSDDWDKHYDGNVNDGNVSPLTLKEYFEGEESYSEFYDLLKSAGVADELGKNQFLTIWAVKNDNYDASDFENLSDSLLGGYHACNLSFTPSDLKSGLRILCLNGIYVTITQKDDANFYVNRSQIISSMRFKNGVVHEISSLMRPLINMFEYIKTLSDDYSIIRDSITFYNTKVFDQVNSTPIGVDISGNTIYDSVFVDDNPLFKKVAINSEFKQFTMFLPSNEVIKEYYRKMRQQYEMMNWQFTKEDSILGMSWIKESIIHEGYYDNYHEKVDLVSPFNDPDAKPQKILRVWRTSVQKVDEENVDELSNGLVYKVTDMKIPNNVLIDRIKSFVYYFKYLTHEEKTAYYIGKGVNPGIVPYGMEAADADKAPVAPSITITNYEILKVHGYPDSDEEFSVEFPPLEYNAATNKASIMKVPPGEYNLYMGFQSTQHPYIDIYFQSGPDYIKDNLLPLRTDVDITAATPWNYDRNNETKEYIARRWDGLGGLVGVVNIEGDTMETFRLKVKFSKDAKTGLGYRQFRIYHWSLKPTENNY